MAKPAHSLTLHIGIDEVAPPVWRRIQVDADTTLRNLHHIFQAAFGWASSHLHQFHIEDDIYTMPDDDYMLHLIEMRGRGLVDDRKAKLGQLVHPGQQFVYLYDFGDSWAHTVNVESSTEGKGKLGYAVVIDGAGACPPEDVGGPHGYTGFLEIIERRPRNQEARDMLEWAGGAFNARAFDKRSANAALLRMAANGWGKK